MTIATLALAAGLVVAATAETTLDPYGWQARPVVVFAEPGDATIERQLARFSSAREAMRERDMVVLVDTTSGSALRRRFEPDGFTVVLVGKDGGEKLRKRRVVDPDEIFALIDTMPMRRREMREAGPAD